MKVADNCYYLQKNTFDWYVYIRQNYRIKANNCISLRPRNSDFRNCLRRRISVCVDSRLSQFRTSMRNFSRVMLSSCMAQAAWCLLWKSINEPVLTGQPNFLEHHQFDMSVFLQCIYLLNRKTLWKPEYIGSRNRGPLLWKKEAYIYFHELSD